MAIVIRKQKYPKMANGGSFEESTIGSFQDYSASAQDNSGEQAANAIASGIQAVPVWGQIVGAGMKLGQGIGKQTTDEYGLYKSKGAEVVDNVFNPSTHLQGWKDFFDKPDAGQLVNNLTLGVFGSNRRQRELERLKRRYEFDKIMTGAAKNEQAGAAMSNSLPAYQAPRYGKDGMKLTVRHTTKFSNFNR